MLDDFVESKRGGIFVTMGDRCINNGNGNANGNSNSNGNSNGNQGTCFADGNDNDNDNGNTIVYIDANNLCGYAMMQKLPYKGFQYYSTSIDEVLNTPDDSDHGYFIICDIKYTNRCKQRTEQNS